MTTIYRKYRPQKFEDLIGQEHITQTIKNEITSQTVAHAFLFNGPRGVGKTTMARLLAKAINCEKRSTDATEPCDDCQSCREISAGNNLDVIEIDAASHTGVDNVRENIIDNAAFKPTKSPFKVFIIDEVHMLSGSAFNALLKTLEEPPSHVIFILATTELHKLPATIISRCQRFNFKKIPSELMTKRLAEIAKTEKKKVDSEVLEQIAVKSDGCLRDAESLLGQILSLGGDKITASDVETVLPPAQLEEAIKFLSAATTAEAIAQLENLATQGQRFDTLAENMITVLRFTLLKNAGYTTPEFNHLTKSQRQGVEALVPKLSGLNLIKAIDLTTKRAQEIKSSALPQLPLEILAVELNEISNNTPDKKDKNKDDSTPPDQIGDPTPPTIEPKKTTASSPVASEISNEQLNSIWDEFTKVIGTTNPSLVFILKMATPENLTDNKLSLLLPYSFHRDKLEEPKTKKLLEESWEKITGQAIKFINKLKSPTPPAATDNLQNLAVEFGGEIIG